jgi:hypothetical protein
MASPLGLAHNTSKTSPGRGPNYKIIDGGTVDGKLKAGKKVKSLFNHSVFSPHPTKGGVDKNGNVLEIKKQKDIHNDNIYDLSIDSIIKYTREAGNHAMRLDYADFAYLKNLGVYPNNRLIVARRFPGPVGNDLHAVSSSPMATLVSWIPESQDNFFNISYNEVWVEADASYTDVLNDMGKDLQMSSDQKGMANMGDFAAAGLNLLPFPGFSEPLQRVIMEKLGLLNNPYQLPLGNPNLIREAKRRKTVGKDQAESGLATTVEVSMVVEYEQKFINGVDPSLVYLDIIQNALTFGTSDAAFQMGSAFARGTNKLIQNLVSGNFSAIFNALKKIVLSIFEAVKEFAQKIIRALVSPPGNGELKESDFTEPLNKAFTFTKKSFSAIIGKYKVRLMGITNALTGSPSTPWHITIGNPKKPVFSSGDMLLKSVDLELGKVLAFNDLPSTIKISLKFENARPLGAQEIFNRLNTGKGRSYIRISMQKDYKSPTEDSANENQEIKNIQDVNTDDTKAKDIITTKSFDDYPYGGESKGGNNKESSADQVFATTDGEGATQEDWFKYANPNEQNGNQAAPNQGPVNMGEATRNENNQVQNPSANNTATNPPSASSGVPQATPPVSIPAASAPPLPTTNLGKTPLDSAAIKNAAPEELNARLSENLKEQKNVMALYQNALFPNIGESPQDFEARKDGLENQLTKLDKESREIKKEKKSRGI